MTKLKPLDLAIEIVTSYVSNNSLPRGELAAVIETVHAAVKNLQSGADAAPVAIEAPSPAVSIRKSVTPEYLICLEDGKRFKSLRRHLATLGMTPEQYREKWGLPSTYPMVARDYAAQRSALAKAAGLGQLRERPVAAPQASVETMEGVEPEPTTIAQSEVEPTSTSEVNPPEVAVKRKPGRPRKVTA